MTRHARLTALLALLVAVPARAQAPALLAPTRNALFAPLPLPTPGATRAADGRPGPAYWQNRTDYRIEARLDTVAHEVTGEVRLTYTNNSPEPLPFLWFHLEQNLFTPESRGHRVDPNPQNSGTAEAGQGFRLGPVTVGGAPVTTTVTDTRMRVDLRAPVAARGGRVEVTIPYAFVVPQDGVGRMGRFPAVQGTVYEIAQWYPRVAVYDDVHGWNTLPYLGQGEFYLDYGDFEYEVTVPAAMTVVGTGMLVNEADVFTPAQRDRIAQARRSAGRVRIVAPGEVGTPAASAARRGMAVWRFRAENVRDVAWAASAAFVYDGVSASVRQDDGSVRDVFVQAAYPAEGLSADPAAPGWEEAARYGRAAILNHSRWYPYPYPVAISVGGGVVGMEYPMLQFSSVGARGSGLFGVVDHELGHNWFPMIVGSDERRYAWMDEGLNTYMNTLSAAAFYADPSRPSAGQTDSTRFQRRVSIPTVTAALRASYAHDQTTMTEADRVRPEAYSWLKYGKPGRGLLLLREVILGPERMDAAFQAYLRRWAYRHPQPADFFRTVEDVAGEDLSWFWREWFYGSGRYDAALAGVGVGVDDDAATATVENRLRLVFPATVEFRFSDGTAERVPIPVEAFALGDTATARVSLRGRTPVSARLDPDGLLPDDDRSNDDRLVQEAP